MRLPAILFVSKSTTLLHCSISNKLPSCVPSCNSLLISKLLTMPLNLIVGLLLKESNAPVIGSNNARWICTSLPLTLAPNISEICYGRTVGYKITKIKLSKDIQNISATKIRKKLRLKGLLKK